MYSNLRLSVSVTVMLYHPPSGIYRPYMIGDLVPTALAEKVKQSV